MRIAKDIARGIVFVVVGVVAIVVGAFMLRGNMHLWDRNKGKTNKEK